MRRKTFTLLGVTLSLALACAGGAAPAADTAADEAAIRAIDANWNTWLAAHNDSAIGAIYTADAVLMPPNLPSVNGGPAIQGFWASLWPMKADLVITPGTTRISGTLAIEDGTWTISVPMPAGPEMDKGKYLVAWEKVGGTWHVTRDIWNSDNPAPTTK